MGDVEGAVAAGVASAPPDDGDAAGRLLLEHAVASGRALARARVVVPTALVLGSAQPVDTVDAEACARDGVTVARRGTGGGAVLCDDDLLWIDVALPAGHPLALADVTEAYGWLARAIAAALAGLGVATEPVPVARARALPPERAAAARLACWAGLSPYELLADGRKLVGLAQRRRRGGVLLQAAVACQRSPGRVARYLRVPPDLRASLDAALADAGALADLGAVATPTEVWERVRPVLARALGAGGT